MTDQDQQKPQPKPPQPAPWWRGMRQVASMLLLSVAVSALSVTIYDRYRYQPIMTVDVEAIMQTKLTRLRESGIALDKAEALAMSERWAQGLDSAVNSMADEYNALVFTRPAVIKGSIDMTQHVLAQLQ